MKYSAKTACVSVLTAFMLVFTAAGCGQPEKTAKPADKTKPAAMLTVDPTAIKPAGSEYAFDASGCKDNKDSPDKLMVRWDWDGDGKWDTPYTVEKKAAHVFPEENTYNVTMEVKDSAGNVSSAVKQVTVGWTDWRPFSDDSPWNTRIPSFTRR